MAISVSGPPAHAYFKGHTYHSHELIDVSVTGVDAIPAESLAPQIARSIELLDHLPANQQGRVIYLTEAVGEGYEAGRMYLGVP